MSFSVSEILLLSKTAKFPFPTMDYSPWSSKNLIDRNRLKKFMHVDIDVTCMYTNFWWVCPLRFRRYHYSQKRPNFPFRPWTSKNVIDRNRPKKFMQVDIDITCMYTNFGGCVFFGFGDTATLKNGQISLSDHGLYIVHGHQKI